MDSRVSVPNQYCARNGEDFAIFHFLKTSLTLLIKNSQTLVKTWFGLTTTRLHTELKRMESPERWLEEKEGTSTMWAHSGLDEKWWERIGAMFFCNLRKMQD